MDPPAGSAVRFLVPLLRAAGEGRPANVVRLSRMVDHDRRRAASRWEGENRLASPSHLITKDRTHAMQNNDDSQMPKSPHYDQSLVDVRLEDSPALDALSRAAETVTELLGEPTDDDPPHGPHVNAVNCRRVAHMVQQLATELKTTDEPAYQRIAHALAAAAAALNGTANSEI